MSANRFSFKGLVGRLLGKADGISLSHPADLVNWNDSGGIMDAGTAMRISAVYSCVRVVGEAIASVPLEVYRRTDEGREKAEDHPLWKLLHDNPAPNMTSFLWRQVLQRHLDLRGNAYCLKVESRRRIVALIPIHPDRVVVDVQRDGSKLFKVYGRDGRYKVYDQTQIFHIVGVSDDGIIGQSPIDILNDTFSAARNAEKYASRAFKNDGATGIVFSFQGKLKPEIREALKKDWNENHAGGENAGRPLLLEEGASASRLNLSLSQMQFIESRKLSRTEIASIFRVPPHMIGDLERATFSNIEHQSLEFVAYTVRPWATRWEASLMLDIVAWYNEPDLFVEFDLDDLARGDIKSRYEAYSSGINAGWLTRNEARVDENRNKIEGLDKPLEPTNMRGQGQLGGNPKDPNNGGGNNNDDGGNQR